MGDPEMDYGEIEWTEDDIPEGAWAECLIRGRCCACDFEGPLIGVVMMSQRAPTPGMGWACMACGLEPDGAIAVLCRECSENFPSGNVILREACAFRAADPERVPVAELVGWHRHDRKHHPEMHPDDPG